MFEDRRGRGDRRIETNRNAVPDARCRRKGERRNLLRQYHSPWWLQTNYAEEVNPPLLLEEMVEKEITAIGSGQD